MLSPTQASNLHIKNNSMNNKSIQFSSKQSLPLEHCLLSPPSVVTKLSYEDDIHIRGYVLQKNLFHGRTFLAGGHVLWEDISYLRAILTG